MKGFERKSAWRKAMQAEKGSMAARSALSICTYSAQGAYERMMVIMGHDVPDDLKREQATAAKAAQAARDAAVTLVNCSAYDRNRSPGDYRSIEQAHNEVKDLAIKAFDLMQAILNRCSEVIDGPVGLRKQLDDLYDKVDEIADLFAHLQFANYGPETGIVADIANLYELLGQADVLARDGRRADAIAKIELVLQATSKINGKLTVLLKQGAEVRQAMSLVRQKLDWLDRDLTQARTLVYEDLTDVYGPNRVRVAADAVNQAATLMDQASSVAYMAAKRIDEGVTRWDVARAEMQTATQLCEQARTSLRVVRQLKRKLGQEDADRPVDS